MKLVKGILVLTFFLIFSTAAFAQNDSCVRIAQLLNHNTLNPAATTSLTDVSVERTIFEGLVGFNRDLELVPELAASWEVSEDATEITFHIREGVTFHDGTPVNAETIKAYFEWALNPENSINARAQSVFENVAKIEVVDPYTLHFTLEKPNSLMIYTFATSNGRILSPAAIEKYGEDVGRHPVGTGPYQFVSWNNPVITLEAYDNYWGEGPPYVECIEFVVVPNAATRVAQLQAGEVAFIEQLPAQLASAVENSSNLEVAVTPSTFMRAFQMNTQVEPFNDVRVRKALNYAINKEQLVDVAIGGYGTVVTSAITDSTRGYAPQPPYEYDPERARELLAEAGYEDGFTAKMLTFNGTLYRTVGQVLQQMLADVGVTLELNPTESGALIEKIFKPIEETELETSLVGANASTGLANRSLVASFATSSWPPAWNNWSFYSNPEVDRLLEEAIHTIDQEERLGMYARVQEIIWNDAPWVFLYSPDSVAGKATNLEGVYYMPIRTLDARNARFVEE